MKKFTHYEARKYRKSELPEFDNSDLKTINMQPSDLEKMIGVSGSTASNWVGQRTPISKIGKQALQYAILMELSKINQEVDKKHDVWQCNGEYNVFFDENNIIKTTSSKICRELECINIMRHFIFNYVALLKKVINISSNMFSLQETEDLKAELMNLIDYAFYMENGDWYSKLYEDMTSDSTIKNDLETIYSAPELKNQQDDVLQKLLQP